MDLSHMDPTLAVLLLITTLAFACRTLGGACSEHTGHTGHTGHTAHTAHTPHTEHSGHTSSCADDDSVTSADAGNSNTDAGPSENEDAPPTYRDLFR